MFTLIIEDKNGALVGEYTFEDGEFIVGRSQQADIQLPADNVSRRHARIFTEDGRCYIQDLNAANGVWVNGRRIHASTELPRSAQVRIGDFFLHIEGAAFARPMTSPIYARLVPMPGSIGELTEMTQSPIMVGRGKDCAVVLQDVSVSRIHAKLTQDDSGRVIAEDLRSSNGTYVNDRRISAQELQHGDRIRFGTVAFSFQIEGMPEPDLSEVAQPQAQRRTQGHAGGQAYAQRAHQAFAPMEHPPEQSYPPEQRTLLPQIAAIAVIVVAFVALVVLAGFAYDRFVAPKLDGKKPDAEAGKAGASKEPKAGDDDDHKAGERAAKRATKGDQELPTPDPKAVAKVQYEELIGQGRDAMQKQQWSEAKGYYERAKRLDVLASIPQEALNKIALEEAAGGAIAQAEEAFKRKDVRAAIRLHKQVPANSVYGVDALKSLQSLADLTELERQRSCHGRPRDAVKCLADCELVLSTGRAGTVTVDECAKFAHQGAKDDKGDKGGGNRR